MKHIGHKIREARIQKRLTQEQLSEMVDRNLRTIQRLENSENTPRKETLELICKALDVNIDEDPKKKYNAKKIVSYIVNWVFLILLNAAIVGIFWWITVESYDGFWQKAVAAYMLSFFIPHFIVLHTPKMNELERTLKFGHGMLLFFILTYYYKGLPTTSLTSMPCSSLFLGVLFYGDGIISLLNNNTKSK